MSRTSTASSSPRKRDGPAVPGAIPERPGEVRADARGPRDRSLEGAGAVVPGRPVRRRRGGGARRGFGRAGPVVEIGGGLGILTAALVRRGIADLTVIERDRRLAHHLRSAFGPRITVLEGDALDIEVPASAVVVGNLPFSSATPILLRLFALRIPRVVALVQKEVAARLAAGPGSRTYGRLSIAASLYGDVELFQEVPESSFFPPPAVRGQIFRPHYTGGTASGPVGRALRGRRTDALLLPPKAARQPPSPGCGRGRGGRDSRARRGLASGLGPTSARGTPPSGVLPTGLRAAAPRQEARPLERTRPRPWSRSALCDGRAGSLVLGGPYAAVLDVGS